MGVLCGEEKDTILLTMSSGKDSGCVGSVFKYPYVHSLSTSISE